MQHITQVTLAIVQYVVLFLFSKPGDTVDGHVSFSPSPPRDDLCMNEVDESDLALHLPLDENNYLQPKSSNPKAYFDSMSNKGRKIGGVIGPTIHNDISEPCMSRSACKSAHSDQDMNFLLYSRTRKKWMYK